MRFVVVVKDGPKEVASIRGRYDLDLSSVSISSADIHKIIETEQFLERLTGYRFHINTEET